MNKLTQWIHDINVLCVQYIIISILTTVAVNAGSPCPWQGISLGGAGSLWRLEERNEFGESWRTDQKIKVWGKKAQQKM